MEKADFEKKYAVFMKQDHEKSSPTVTKTHSLKQKHHREKSRERAKHGSESMKLKPSAGNYGWSCEKWCEPILPESYSTSEA